MHQKVEAFLKEKGVSVQQRQDKLIRWGLWEKEYAPEDGDVIQFPQKDGDGRHWRKKAVQVTEEEWELIQAAAGKKKEKAICIALKTVGVCWIIAIVLEILSLSISLGNILFCAMFSAFSFGFAQLLEKLP